MKISVENEHIINDKLGVVCCYFNPCNYLSRYINFISFYQALANYKNVDVCVVESHSINSKYRINKVCDNLISVESSEIYWQKEQLLNMGISHMYNKGYECIAWLDADIIFTNKDWVHKSMTSIRITKATQLFETCIKKLPNNKQITSKSTSSFFKGNIPCISKMLTRPGEPGFAYGYHRHFLKKFKLYENAIMGSGDFLNLIGSLYSADTLQLKLKNDRFFKKCNPEFLTDYTDWVFNNGADITKLEVPKNTIKIEYHGTLTRRFYVTRERILRNTKYSPKKDLTLTESGMYIIKNQELKKDIASYFYSREEDHFIGNINKNIPYRNKILNLILKNNPNYDITKLEIDNLHELAKTEKNDPHICMPKLSTKISSVVVASKTTHEFFATKRISADFHIIIDKSNYPQTNTIKSEMGSGDPQTYLSFIIKNYDRLPRICTFVSDILKNQDHEYQKSVNRVVKNMNQSFNEIVHLTNTYKNFYVDKEVHLMELNKSNTIIKSKHNYINWINKFIPNTGVSLLRRTTNGVTMHMMMQSGIQLRFNPNNSFVITKDQILKNDLSFYKDLHSCVSGVFDAEEMLYINRSWGLIFT